MRTMSFGTILLTLLTLSACATPQAKEERPPVAVRTTNVQSSADSNMQILMEKIKADKKLLVANNLDLTDAEAKQFWPIYGAYQHDLDQVNEQLGNTIQEYAAAYSKGPIPDDTADKLLNEALGVEEQEIKLKRAYAEELGKIMPQSKAARYLQIETKIRSLLRAELAQHIPLVY
jgi:hypothetical protein